MIHNNREGIGILLVRRSLFVALPLALLVAFSVAFSGAPAQAVPLAVAVSDGEAFDVSADRLEVDVEKGTATLSGNVSAKFGELDVKCPTVEIRYDRSPRVSWAKGSGGVSARMKGIDATASIVEFDAGARTVALHGGVRLTRGKGWLTAEHATVDIATGKVSLQDVKGSIPVDPAKR
jgi:lipopolysaccharide export system protein LptA